jgi:DNA-binding NarL/FixJ family response regulator
MRILIADDNQLVRSSVAALLSSEEGWIVCGGAQNADETLSLAQQHSPEVVLLDVSMPGRNGLEIARLLRQQFPNLKILMISQHDPGHLMPRALEAGANHCIDKACLARDLIPAIKSLIDS